MDYDFSSLKELYERVTPALNVKETELQRLGFSNIKGFDVWNYLIETRWKNGNDLMLSDIVSDIMNCDCSELNNYLKNKNDNEGKTQIFDDVDII